jgi:hypothetical protein
MTNEATVIPKWVWIGLALLVLLGLGWVISPRDQANRPILLLPDTKTLEDYRLSIADWQTRMQALDAQIASVLSGRFGSDLFSKSREAQKVMDTAIGLAQEIDRRDAPTAALPAKTLLAQSANDYIQASRDMLQWVSAPTAENLAAAQQALAAARQSLARLEQSEWTRP